MVSENSILYRPDVSPTATAEKFIGSLGSNLRFIAHNSKDEALVILSGSDVISILNIQLGDPRLDKIKTIFSRLTQVAEVRGAAVSDFPYPEPYQQSLMIPTVFRERVAEVVRQNRPIEVNYESFAREFVKHLRAFGMNGLASRLTFLSTKI